jgi:hypothetical protein
MLYNAMHACVFVYTEYYTHPHIHVHICIHTLSHTHTHTHTIAAHRYMAGLIRETIIAMKQEIAFRLLPLKVHNNSPATGDKKKWYYADLWGSDLKSLVDDKHSNLKEVAEVLAAAVQHLHDDKLTLRARKMPWGGQVALTGLEKAALVLSQLANQSNNQTGSQDCTRKYGDGGVVAGEGSGLHMVGRFSRPLYWAGFVVVGGRTWLSEYDEQSSNDDDDDDDDD